MIQKKEKFGIGKNVVKAQRECVIRLLDRKDSGEEEMMKIVRQVCRDYCVDCVNLKKSHLLEVYHNLLTKENIERSEKFENLIKKRGIRTASGVSVISVMTKPLGCPGQCVYCPNQANMPKSYLDNQPAAMRGVMNDFDPFEQVYSRLEMLAKMGHDVSKNEVIVLGGTFSAHPVRYQELFVKRLFDAFNMFGKKYDGKIVDNLNQAKTTNETAECRMIGLTIETRPDYITKDELKWLRYLGVTRVELGVQSVNDDILLDVKRGHDVESIKNATHLLRLAGFKIVYHMMPGLPGSTIGRDVEMFEELFSDQGFFPDHLKIYPTVVLENSELYDWWLAGKYKPYEEKEVVEVLGRIKEKIPPWVRIVRVMRDIPENSIVAGVKCSNLRQILQNRGVKCKCIRCREPRNKKISNFKSRITNYQVNGGEEYFLNMESDDGNYILALLRLFLPAVDELGTIMPEIQNCAMIRELHTYGVVAGVDEKGNQTQHRGMGKKLMLQAEEIARNNGYKKMAVISGVGVRQYYKKIGYSLKGEYMVKDLV